MAAPEFFFSAGEISGDLHAGRLLAALRSRSPGLSAFGIGGRELESAGMEKIADISQLSLIGIAEVVPRLFSLYRLFSEVKKTLARRRPSAVILVDSPDFNLGLARHARSLGIKVIYYISPTVWAWRRGRIKTIGRNVDHMLTILPFEEDLYRGIGVKATYVGHPLIDRARGAVTREDFLEGLGLDPGTCLISILPGSRRNEVRSLLPILLHAGSLLARHPSRPRFVIPAASGELYDSILPLVQRSLPGTLVLRGRAMDCLAASWAAIVTSGTATLEAALQGTPFVTVYRLSPLTYYLGRLMVRTPWISLPNIILQEPVVEEYIQHDCSPETVAAGVSRLLDGGDAVARMKEHFGRLRSKLGPGDAAERAAAAVARETGLGAFASTGSPSQE
jgi:lipid-A-disaccharide synthase